MKIGIMTINSAYNYGCVLQAWSLQRYLEKVGHEASIINYRIPEIDSVYRLFQERQRFGNRALNSVYNGLRRIKFNLTQKPRIKKAEKFEHFINETMNTTKVYSSFTELEEQDAGAPYDVLITGSDQVWNGSITKGLKPAYFLEFDHSDKKKISYAASIGKTELTNAEREFFTKCLEKYDNIAVREQSAKMLLQPLVKQEITVVADPTLLLEREDFDAVKKKPRFREPYLLVHIIGKDRNVKSIAKMMSEKLGLRIVQNRMKKQYEHELGRFSDAGPEEFIGLIEGASFIVTNSFHATLFAIMYERNFITIPHKVYPERMTYLLEQTELSDHLIADAAELPEDFSMPMPDYAKVKARLAKHQEASRAYLENCLARTK